MRGDGLHEGLVVDTAAADVKLGGVRGEPCDGVRDRAGGQFDERSCDVFGRQALMAAKAGVEPGGREELPCPSTSEWEVQSRARSEGRREASC